MKHRRGARGGRCIESPIPGDIARGPEADTRSKGFASVTRRRERTGPPGTPFPLTSCRPGGLCYTKVSRPRSRTQALPFESSDLRGQVLSRGPETPPQGRKRDDGPAMPQSATPAPPALFLAHAHLGLRAGENGPCHDNHRGVAAFALTLGNRSLGVERDGLGVAVVGWKGHGPSRLQHPATNYPNNFFALSCSQS